MLLEHLLSSSRRGPPLRVAAIVEEGWRGRPDVHALDHVLRSDFARLVLLIDEQRPVAGAPARAAAALGRLAERRSRSRLLFELYERWDRARVAAPAGPDAATLDDRLAEVPVLRVAALDEGDAVRYPDDALARIREQQIDVAVRFARGRLAVDAASIARYGVWSYRLGDDERYPGGPPHFWELVERNPVSGVSLEVTRQAPSPRIVLCKGVAATSFDESGLSLARNRLKPELLGSTFVLRKLKQLHEHGFGALERDAVPPAPVRGKRVSYGVPSNLEMARFLVPRLAAKARPRLRPRKVVQWRIGVRVNGRAPLAPNGPAPLDGFHWVEAPRGRLWADPFVIERKAQPYCFFEDLDHARRVGRISCAVVDAAGELRDVQPALEMPYHLSYPFVFEDGGETFMIPESRKNGTVDLFRAVEFPGRWEKVRTLLHGGGLDTTVVRTHGLYWFFVAVREPAGGGEQLLLYHAESLTGPLRFHPRNPIGADVRCCRPAGAIFVRDGRLVRPAQDCSVTYGRQLTFVEIVTLTPDDYREEVVGTVAPPRGLDGIHTYNRCGAVEVVDGKRLEPASRHLARLER